MNLLGFLRPRSTAPVARERLQILLAHERVPNGRPGLTALLKELGRASPDERRERAGEGEVRAAA